MKKIVRQRGRHFAVGKEAALVLRRRRKLCGGFSGAWRGGYVPLWLGIKDGDVLLCCDDEENCMAVFAAGSGR